MSRKVKMVWKSLHPKDTRNLQPVQDQVNHSHKVLQSVDIGEENYFKHAKEIVHKFSVVAKLKSYLQKNKITQIIKFIPKATCMYSGFSLRF